jgi:hypothetical protein
MRLPREKIVFIVDTIPVGQVPGRGFIDMYPLEAEDFIKKVIAMDWDRLIPGHPGVNGRLGTKQDARDQLRLLEEASAEMKPLGISGKCWATEKDLKLSNFKDCTSRAWNSSAGGTAASGAAGRKAPIDGARKKKACLFSLSRLRGGQGGGSSRKRSAGRPTPALPPVAGHRPRWPFGSMAAFRARPRSIRPSYFPATAL